MVLIFPSSSLKGLNARGVGRPGAFVTAAIVCRVGVDIDLETGRRAFGLVLEKAVEEEDKDRRCEKGRCDFGRLCWVQPATWTKLGRIILLVREAESGGHCLVLAYSDIFHYWNNTYLL
jgi:hypothetical protein